MSCCFNICPFGFNRSKPTQASREPLLPKKTALNIPYLHTKTIEKLHILNSIKSIMYKNDYMNNEIYTSSPETMMDLVLPPEFKLINGFDYEYSGKNPAHAIQSLLTIEPLILECGQALCLAQTLATIEILGAAKFNSLIEQKYGRSLIITNAPLLPLKTEEQVYQQDFIIGDNVYLFGNPYGFGVHPTSQFNGYNLIVTGFNKGEPLLSGFFAKEHPPILERDLLGLLNEEFKKPLSYGDIFTIDQNYRNNPDEYPQHSPMTWKEVYTILNKNPEFKREVKRILLLPHKYFCTESKITIPEIFQKPPMGFLRRLRYL